MSWLRLMKGGHQKMCHNNIVDIHFVSCVGGISLEGGRNELVEFVSNLTAITIQGMQHNLKTSVKLNISKKING
jgi:hypothetical protein